MPFRTRLRRYFWPVAVETEVDEEIAAHMAMQEKRYIESGMSVAEARQAALRRFGNIEQVREECRAIRHHMEDDVRQAELREEIRMDAMFALRTLRKSPLFTFIALLTIAIGVGANVAIFSVVQSVLLRPLPYRHADRTVALYNNYSLSGVARTAVSAPEYFDLKERLRAFDEVGAIAPQPSTIVGKEGEPERLMAYVVTPNLFTLLGASAALGRTFAPDEGKPQSEKVIVLSQALWMRRFGGDPAILNTQVNVAGVSRTIVGVMPADVRFPDAPVDWLRERADLWIPNTWEDVRSGSRGNQNLAVLARVGAGVSPAQVRADLAAEEQRFKRAFPSRYAAPAVPEWKIGMTFLRDDMVGAVRPALLMLAGAVSFVLLIACVNVANLLLARGALRQREMAVRLSLGAARPRLVRQLLTESTILALVGGLLGVVVAWLGVYAVVRLAANNIPRLDATHLDGTALAFSVGISIVTGILIGIVPALQQSRTDLRGAFGEGSRGSSDGRGRRRLRTTLVIAQVAMALVVLVAAGLLGRSFLALQRVEPGFSPDGVMTMQLTLSRAKYDSLFKATTFYQQLQSRLAEIPGVTAASAVYPLPMSDDGWSGSFVVEGEPAGPTIQMPHAEMAVAMPGYFRAMGIPLRAGREFAETDHETSPRVVIVDEQLAKRHWPTQSAIGKRINTSGAENDWITVAGVVGHVHNSGPQQEGEPQLYFPVPQEPQRVLSVLVRTSLPPATLAPAMRTAVHALDADLAVAKLRTMDQLVVAAVSRQRFNTMMIAAFALAALALASIGLYGVMSYLVAQRTREIGIRLALGGQPGDVRGMVVRESMVIAVTGLAVGAAISLALSRLLAGLLFGVQPTDLVTYGSIAALLLLVAVFASYGPARRATRIDPVAALRE